GRALLGGPGRERGARRARGARAQDARRRPRRARPRRAGDGRPRPRQPPAADGGRGGAGGDARRDLRSAARGVRRAPAFGDVLMRRARVAAAALAGALLAAFVPAPDKPTPQPEDGARITRGRIKIAVAPVLDMTATGADLRRVPYLLGTVLERSKRFQVVDPIAVGDMFASGGLRVEEMLARPERAVRAAKNLDVAGWVVPVLLERRGGVTLDVTYISAITGVALFSRRLPLLPNSAVEEQRFPWEPPVED